MAREFPISSRHALSSRPRSRKSVFYGSRGASHRRARASTPCDGSRPCDRRHRACRRSRGLRPNRPDLDRALVSVLGQRDLDVVSFGEVRDPTHLRIDGKNVGPAHWGSTTYGSCARSRTSRRSGRDPYVRTRARRPRSVRRYDTPCRTYPACNGSGTRQRSNGLHRDLTRDPWSRSIRDRAREAPVAKRGR